MIVKKKSDEYKKRNTNLIENIEYMNCIDN